jgi:hypothetical protein
VIVSIDLLRSCGVILGCCSSVTLGCLGRGLEQAGNDEVFGLHGCVTTLCSFLAKFLLDSLLKKNVEKGKMTEADREAIRKR